MELLSARTLLAIAAASLIYSILKYTYRYFFHPLRNIPGPRLAAISRLYITHCWLSGHWSQHLVSLHSHYGPIVRVAPNEVSFTSATSIRRIYGHTPLFPKSALYDSAPPGTAKNILTTRDPAQHAQMRKLLSHAFSTKALTEQEDIIHHYVDIFIQRLQELGSRKEGVEMVRYFNYITFDLIGDLAFGEPFGCLSDGKYHVWVATIIDSMWAVTVLSAAVRWPWLASLRFKLIPKKLMEPRERHVAYSREKIERRMEAHTKRKDFMTPILRQKEARGVSFETLAAQASVIIGAGSETTGTFLCGTCYHLCKSPHAYARLQSEIRTRFKTYTAITGHSTEPLPYLSAVISEGLRIFPPVAIGPPRESPGETVDGVFLPAGTSVYTSAFAATHLSSNFTRPSEFLPERWLGQDRQFANDVRGASEPFSIGPRACLGQNLAYLEMRVILAKMVWAFEWSLAEPEVKWEEGLREWMLWKKPELWIRFLGRTDLDDRGGSVDVVEMVHPAWC